MDDKSPYDEFLELEKLETLLEDLEDAGVEGNLLAPNMDGDLRARLDDVHVSNVEDLRAMIAGLHSRLDAQEKDSC
jgi:hypothetical protein